MMENIDAIDRLEKHNRTYVPGASEENNNKFLGPDEIDLLVDAHRIEREEKEMRIRRNKIREIVRSQVGVE